MDDKLEASIVKELSKRVLVALWGIPILLGMSYLGGVYFLLLILVINGMVLWEFYSIFRNQQVEAYRILAVVLSTVFLLAAYIFPPQQLPAFYLMLITIVLFRHLRLSAPNSSTNTLFTLGGISYITLFLASLLHLRLYFATWQHLSPARLPGGRLMVILWISIWVCDTFAYFGGSLLGNHKLAPQTSPNKTIEGALFGLIGALLIFVPLGKWLLPEVNPLYFWFAGGIVGILGQIGDLVESRFKRDAGVKDTSTILPGHGGFFDRFDSLMFVSPFMYVLFQYIRF